VPYKSIDPKYSLISAQLKEVEVFGRYYKFQLDSC